jgi:lipid-binding SYLF domain-containing protein
MSHASPLSRRQLARRSLVALGALALAPAMAAAPALADTAAEIDAAADAALLRFYNKVKDGKAFLEKANGILIFPKIIKAAIGIGGSYGEGVLRTGGKSVAYYSATSASIGVSLGAESRSVIVAFLTQNALTNFRFASSGWTAGVDGSVALVNIGAGGTIDNNSVKGPIVYFVFDSSGLMVNLSIEGTKFTQIKR